MASFAFDRVRNSSKRAEHFTSVVAISGHELRALKPIGVAKGSMECVFIEQE